MVTSYRKSLLTTFEGALSRRVWCVQVISVLKLLLGSFTRTQNPPAELRIGYQMTFCMESKPKYYFALFSRHRLRTLKLDNFFQVSIHFHPRQP